MADVDNINAILSPDVKINVQTEATQIKNTELAEELALPPVKIHCSVWAESAIKAAITAYKEKAGNNRE